MSIEKSSMSEGTKGRRYVSITIRLEQRPSSINKHATRWRGYVPDMIVYIAAAPQLKWSKLVVLDIFYL